MLNVLFETFLVWLWLRVILRMTKGTAVAHGVLATRVSALLKKRDECAARGSELQDQELVHTSIRVLSFPYRTILKYWATEAELQYIPLCIQNFILMFRSMRPLDSTCGKSTIPHLEEPFDPRVARQWSPFQW
jgi:hypothetical protein